MKDSKNDIRTSSTRSNETLAAQTTLSSAMQPVITEIYSDSGRTIGAVLPGTSIDDATPRFTGRAEPGSLVEIFSWGVKLGEGYANDDGIFSFTTTTPFQAGGQLISVKSTQANGEVWDRAYYDLTYIAIRHPLDAAQPVNQDPVLSKPVIEGAYDNRNGEVLIEGRYTEDTTPLLKGTADPLAMLYVKNRIGQVVGSVQANSEGKWELEVQSTIGGSWVVVAVDPNDPSSVSYASEEIDIRIGVEPPPPLPTPDIWSVYDNEDIGSRLNSGDTTDDTTPTFSGGAYARGMTIIVRNHGKEIGQTEVNSDGEWSWTPASALEAGSYSLTFEVVDNEGNVHASEPFILEVVIPVVAQILYADDNVGDVTDPLNTGDRTDDETPTLHGSANPNSLVKIYYKGYYYLGSAESNANGEWSFTPSNKLPAGIHNFFAREVNEHGTELAKSPEFTLEIVPVIEYTAPTVSNVYDNVLAQKYLNNGSITDDTTPRFSGRGTPNSTLEVRDNGTFITEVQVNSSGNWSWTSTQGLEPGEHRFSFVTVGEDGREYASADFNLEIITQLAGRIDSAGDNVGAVTDPLISGSRTDDTTPTLNGAGTPGGIARIYDNNRLIGSAKINESGEWSFTPSSALAAGAHNFYAKVTGPDGTVLANSPTFSLTIAPPVSYTAPTVSNVYDNVLTQKYLSSGSITDDTTPRFSGRGTPNSTLEVRDNGTFITEVQVNSSGNWSWTANQPLKPGEHRFSFVTVGEDGGEYASADFNLEIISHVAGRIDIAEDNVGRVTDPLTNGSKTDDSTPTLKGVGTPGGKVEIYDRYNYLGTAEINAEGNWSFTPLRNLQDGSYSFRAHVISPDGTRLSQSEPFNLIIAKPVEYYAPIINNIQDNEGYRSSLMGGGITDDTTPTFTGYGVPNSIIEVRINGETIQTVNVNGSGGWFYTPSPALKPGKHEFTFVSTDESGKEFSTAIIPLEIITHIVGNIESADDNVGDNTDPLLNGAHTDDTQPTLRGVGTPNGHAEIYRHGMYQTTVSINEKGEWSYTPVNALDNGTHKFTATVISPDGGRLNPSPAFMLTVKAPVDYFAPIIEVVFDGVGRMDVLSNGDTTDDTRPSFTGKATLGSKVAVYVDGIYQTSSDVSSSGSWFYMPSRSLENGKHTFSFVTVDDKGNEYRSEAFTLTIEPLVPSRILSADDNVGNVTDLLVDGSRTDDTLPVFHGTGARNGTVTVYTHAGLVGTAKIRADGTWSLTPETPLAIGSHEFKALVTDANGFTDLPSPAFQLVVTSLDDFQAPTFLYGIDTEGRQEIVYSGGISDDTTPTLHGAGHPNSTVRIRHTATGNEVEVPVNAQGWWSWTPVASLSEGEHSFTVIGIDEDLNEHSAENGNGYVVNIVYPTDNKIVSATDDIGSTETLLAGAQTDDATPTLHGLSVANADVWVYDNDKFIGMAVANEKGEWHFTPEEPLPMGVHHFSARSHDPLSTNMTPASPTFALEIVPVVDAPVEPEVAPPPPVILAAYDNRDGERLIGEGEPSGDPNPLLRGTAQPLSIVRVMQAQYSFGTAIADENGNWSLELTRVAGKVSLTAMAINPDNDLFLPSEFSEVFPLLIRDDGRDHDLRSLLQDADASLFAEPEPEIRTTQPVEPVAFVPASVALAADWETPHHE